MIKDHKSVRSLFPFFENPDAPVYLDSAATAQKPQCVIDRVAAFYSRENANIHRGSYPLSDAATRAYESSRRDIAAFIGAKADQTAFTQNATDALNQAAFALGRKRVRPGSNVIVSALEHHSASLPFLRLCKEKKAELRIIPLGDDGIPQLERLCEMADNRTAAAVITAGSNSTGWRAPLDGIASFFQARSIPLVIDATQRIVHERIDFQKLSCDFLCFSGHKLYGPMGVGILAMKEEWRAEEPERLGGGTVKDVTENGYVLFDGIEVSEAGTPPVAQVLGLQSAINFLNEQNLEELFEHEKTLCDRLMNGLNAMGGIRIFPAGENRLPLVSFISEEVHPADMAQLLSIRGIAVRCGRHCAHIAHQTLGVEATIRASIGIYNNEEDIDRLLEAVEHIQKRWRKRRGQ